MLRFVSLTSTKKNPPTHKCAYIKISLTWEEEEDDDGYDVNDELFLWIVWPSKIREAWFPAGTIGRVSLHGILSTCHEQGLNLWRIQVPTLQNEVESV